MLFFAAEQSAKNNISRIIPEETGDDSTAPEPAVSKFFKEFFKLEKPDTSFKSANTSDFSQKEGRIIRVIRVKVLDLFGTSVYDTLKQPQGWLSKTGNALHVNTRDWLIKNNLMFQEGDPLDSYQLAESERFLRQNNNIYDARIIATDVPGSPDSVDVTVFVQDIWSISGDASVNRKIDHGFIAIKDINFLGLGTELGTKVKFSDQYSGNWNWDGNLLWNNINRTFFNGRISRRTTGSDLQWGIGINKDFFSPLVKWAGGIDMDWFKSQFWVKKDTAFTRNEWSYAVFDMWGGYATGFRTNSYPIRKQNKFNFSLRVTRTNYTDLPEDDSASFQNNSFFLSRIGFAQKNFYKDRYIFGLGRTEDIPVGFIGALLYGYETGALFHRPYYGIYSGYSKFDYQFGYFYFGVQAGAFRQNSAWKNSITSMNLLYISKLYLKGSFKWRHYLWSRFSYLSDPFASYLSINNNEGLRGAGSDKKGNKKVVINYENNLFTPLSILGFNIAFISFADLALLSERSESLLNSKLYQGYGLGFRIRNEHLITGTIQIMFGYYPGKGAGAFNLFEQSRSFYQLDQFRFGKPGLIDF